MVHQVPQSELISGSIADTVARLLLWGKRPLGSLARVEFSSEFSRQKVISELSYQLKEKEIPFQEIKLPLWENPSVVFNFLFTELEKLSSGVVSISGFETAFNRDIPLFEALRIINFNRENLAQFNLRQIWWMSRPFNSEAIKVMPDLNSWFSLRLFLTEDISQNVFVNANHLDVGDKVNVLFSHNLPSRSNREFIGREKELQQIDQSFNEYPIIALSGMGGVGKTELALQYAWKEWDNKSYLGGVCWLNALNNDAGIQIVNFASQFLKLMLPEQGTLRERVGYCWQHWPVGDVLIIFDDVRDYEDIKPYLPPKQDQRFKVLITTRFNYLSQQIHTINLDLLTEADALTLLEINLGYERIHTQLEDAKKLCLELGYLPLALELVVRLLKQEKDWTIEAIRHRLIEKGLEDQSLTHIGADMTAERGVKASLELSWQQLDNEPKAQTLALYLSLFALAPFSLSLIKELLFDEKEDDVEEWLMNSLVRFSFVQDLEGNQYQLHTLIRRYLLDKLDQSDLTNTAKLRYCSVMSNLSRQIPNTPILDDIANFTPLIPHLEQAATEFQNHIADDDILGLYGGLSRYYSGQGLYALAEPWLTDCLKLTQIRFGEHHLNVATSLNNLAELYYYQGRYSEAEPLYVRSLSIREQQLGKNHPDTATSLNNLALLYYFQGRYSEAEPLLVRALSITEQQSGNNHPNTALSLNNLAGLYESQGRYSEAESLYIRALSIREQQLGKNHPLTASSLNNLAALYDFQERYSEAEPLYIRALFICEQQLGKTHPDTATSLNNLALLYNSQRRYSEAEPLYVRALSIREQQLGKNHPNTATSLNNLAGLYYSQGRYSKAESLYVRAINILQATLGNEHLNTQTVIENYMMMLAQLPNEE